MGLYKITAKKTGSWGGKKMEKGMSVEKGAVIWGVIYYILYNYYLS
jgi:hypothetical protein